MPWTTPTLRQVREMTRDFVTASLGSAALIPNSVLRIMSDAKAGLAHLTLLYIDWLSKQFLPDTAEQEWLDRHGTIWLKNADGSKGRKVAQPAVGTITVYAQVGFGPVTVPKFTQFKGPQQYAYETNEEILAEEVGTQVAVTCLVPGETSNLELGDKMTLADVVPNLDSLADVVTMTGGTDAENDDDLRERVLFRIQQPPMGGDAADYVLWALAVPGVTRAWAAPLEMGPGTLTIRFMMDDLRSEQGGFPNAEDIATVTAYIDSVRPVAIKDRWILAPLPEPIDVLISDLENDTVAIRNGIEVAIQEALRRVAAPAHAVNGVMQEAQTIYANWMSDAIMSVPGVRRFRLDMPDHPMPTAGHIAVLGSIVYG